MLVVCYERGSQMTNFSQRRQWLTCYLSNHLPCAWWPLSHIIQDTCILLNSGVPTHNQTLSITTHHSHEVNRLSPLLCTASNKVGWPWEHTTTASRVNKLWRTVRTTCLLLTSSTTLYLQLYHQSRRKPSETTQQSIAAHRHSVIGSVEFLTL